MNAPLTRARRFRATFGETPHRYLLTRRMERAAFLLRTSDLSVLEVCHAVGFSSAGSFATTFKRLYGVTPSGCRPVADGSFREDGAAVPD